jgi:hypothetical protein
MWNVLVRELSVAQRQRFRRGLDELVAALDGA